MIMPVVASGRITAERLMTDTFRIDSIARSAAPDPATLNYTEVPTAQYSGPGELKWDNVQPRDATPAGQDVTAQTATLKLPMATSGAVKPGMRVTCLSSEDPDLVGRTFMVTGRFHKTHATSRRFPVEEYT